MRNRLAELEMSLSRYQPKKSGRQLGLGAGVRPRLNRRSRAFGGSVDYRVPGPFSVIAQQKSMGCWAAAITMLTNWRLQQSRSVETVLADIGDRWLRIYKDNTGLYPRDEAALIREAGLTAQRDINLGIQGWVDLLRHHGPVWVTVDMAPGRRGGMHARIITGIHGDGTANGTSLDIIDPEGGTQYQETLARFIPRFEAEIRETGRTRFQFYYWPAGRVASHGLSLSDKARRVYGINNRSFSFSGDIINYSVPGIVPVLAQPTNMTCWATTFTMLHSWKHNQSVDIAEAVGSVGPQWHQKYAGNQGLSPSEKVTFLAQAGLSAEPPMNLSVDGWEQLLRNFGPLWVTTDEAAGAPWAIHARIITGIRGDGTAGGSSFQIIDPAGGRQYTETVAAFIPKFEEEVAKTGHTRIQIVHWPRGARMSQQQSAYQHTHLHGASSRSYASAAMSPVIAMNQSFDIRYNVQLIPQMTCMSCWAAGAAMIVGWRDRISINPDEIARRVGYWKQYGEPDSCSGGLHPEDTKMLTSWGLVSEAPTSYTVAGFKQLLLDYGPLWVAAATPGPHIRVVTGIQGDGSPDGTHVSINDPWEKGMKDFRGPDDPRPNRGSQYTESYREFVRKQSELGEREMAVNAPIYVAHLPALPDWFTNGGEESR
ncbi:MAG: papain-like cysteine protease family protein [Chitinivibrionales bacterium]